MTIYDQAREASKLMRGEDHERAKGYGILVKIKKPLATAYVDKCDEHEALKARLAALADELDRHGDEDEREGKPDGARAYWHTAAKIRAVMEGEK